jgi:diketogulonate reductase-like aldo/keto reductase
LEVLDLYLIHAPWPWNEMGKDCTQGNVDSWRAMEKLYTDGRIRCHRDLQFRSASHPTAVGHRCTIVPHANQIPFWIGHTKKETVAFCEKHHIAIEAYSPLATGRLFQKRTVGGHRQ